MLGITLVHIIFGTKLGSKSNNARLNVHTVRVSHFVEPKVSISMPPSKFCYMNEELLPSMDLTVTVPILNLSSLLSNSSVNFPRNSSLMFSRTRVAFGLFHSGHR